MLRTLQDIESEARERLAAVETGQDLSRWRSRYLGKGGQLSALLRSLGALPAEQRPAAGRQANELKHRLQAALEDRKETLDRVPDEPSVDVTLPGSPPRAGRLHPITITMRRMRAAFGQMGFQVWEGRDVETDEYNFELLNMPRHHPARDSHDTFYTTRPDVLLRTHTSPAQVRVMRQSGAPVRAVVPGTCYRYDQPDASHNFLFNQMEGLAVGPNIRMSDLFGAIGGLVRLIFGEGSKIRFRAHHFPFTEPSIETDLWCTVCAGAGCRLCKGSGWVEIIPGGMIHPVVLRNGGIDPDLCSGFAFGAGVDRIAALLHGMNDIRVLYRNDTRLLSQF